MAKPNLELFDSEWTILQVVWKHEPCTAPTVQEILAGEKGWAYTTVKTLMDRMVKKGLLRTEKIRNLYLYVSAVTPTQAKSGEIRRTLKRAFEGALTPMMQFLIENESLSEAEYARLELMIQNRKKAAMVKSRARQVHSCEKSEEGRK
jgi:BlaI family transcriptional regulator, penicillinase repressor